MCVAQETKHPRSQARGHGGVCHGHRQSRTRQSEGISEPSLSLGGREGHRGLAGDTGCWLPAEGGQTRTCSPLSILLSSPAKMPLRGHEGEDAVTTATPTKRFLHQTPAKPTQTPQITGNRGWAAPLPSRLRSNGSCKSPAISNITASHPGRGDG